MLLMIFVGTLANGQQLKLSGRVVHAGTLLPIEGCQLQLVGITEKITSDVNGEFLLELDVSYTGDQVLKVEKEGFRSVSLELVITLAGTHIDPLILAPDEDQVKATLIQLSQEDLQNQENLNPTPSFLSARRNALEQAAAFDFSAGYFRLRGLTSDRRTVMINGMEMNTFDAGRARWAYWGGLNDAHRQTDSESGSRPGSYSLGSLGRSDDLKMRAGIQRKGGRLAYSLSNRSYTFRLMASYFTGLMKNGWSFAFTASVRQGSSGYIQGTSYEGRSIFFGAERQITPGSSLSAQFIFTPVERGLSSPVTQETIDLKGSRYNPNWGLYADVNRNSRTRSYSAPFLSVSYRYKPNENTWFEFTSAFMKPSSRNQRIDNGGTTLGVTEDGQEYFLGGGSNPYPNYYQRMPSYFLRNNPGPADFQKALIAQYELLKDGQVDWTSIRAANEQVLSLGGNSQYIVGADASSGKQFWFRSTLGFELSSRIRITTSAMWRSSVDNRYGEVIDLLGGSGFLDIDTFAEDGLGLLAADVAQSDLQNRNRIVAVGDKYKYNYQLSGSQIGLYSQLRFTWPNWNGYVALTAAHTQYRREGFYENGYYPGSESLGRSDNLRFLTGGFKAGAIIQSTPNRAFEFNLVGLNAPPFWRNSFANPRQNNKVVEQLSPELLFGGDIGYQLRSKWYRLRVTAYGYQARQGSSVSFYFTENLSGLGLNADAFVQEVTTDIGRQYLGGELSSTLMLSDQFSVRCVAAYGQHQFITDPELYLMSDDFEGELRFGNGRSRMTGVRLPNGPQQAYQLAFTYNSPDYWWLGVSFSHLRDSFISVSRLSRSDNLRLDYDGLPLENYDPLVAEELLEQQELPPISLLNLVGGKSWRVGKQTLGFFLVLNNILSNKYLTGGFEQSRYATFNDLRRDIQRPYGRLFGPRFYSGLGLTYFTNLYIRF